ncbi:MFS transporter [Apiospora arundinis]
MKHLRILFLLLGVLFSQAIAKSAPTFCKCTCFKNSTIVPLGPKDASDNTPSHAKPPPESSNRNLFLRSLNPFTTDDAPQLSSRAASASCAQCTRKFCLDYGFPFCKKAEEKDVVTMCFQRDSRKDQIIVWGFIFGTLGLLGWAGVKRITEMREDKQKVVAAGGIGLPGGRQDRGNYVPVEVR